MTISVGDQLPAATLLVMGAEGPEEFDLGARTKGRRVAMFAVPGAFTPTCNDDHMPSFVGNSEALAEKGIEEVICISVNDPFVMNAWGQSTGAADAGITMLSDSDGSFTQAIGLAFSAGEFGIYGRSQRYSMLVDDGTVKVLNVEESPGVCEVSSGGELLKDC